MSKIKVSTVDVTLKSTFRTAHGAADTKKLVIVDIDGGLGEASPVNYYGENVETVIDFIKRADDNAAIDPNRIEHLSTYLDSIAAGNGAAKAAIDIALHDLLGKKLNMPVCSLYGVVPRNDIASSYTISISDPDTMKRETLANPGYHVYKVKVGVPGDIEMVAAVREATKARIRVDANAGWSAREAVQKIKELAKYDIEFVEQPLHWKDFEGFKLLRHMVDLPILADEGIMRAEDIPQYYGLVDGINIKLQKSGGIREAYRMICTARALKMKIMIGCMVETSISISAAAQLAPLVDYVDLDGNILIQDDPFDGVRAVNGFLKYTERPGIGVIPKR